MTDSSPSLSSQRRHLLPRSPSDRVILLALAAGSLAAFGFRIDPIIGLIPGCVVALTQKINGHVQAWRIGGVERAFVMESSAISFYALAAALIVVGALQGAGLVTHFNTVWWFDVALVIDTIVRSSRESRYV